MGLEDKIADLKISNNKPKSKNVLKKNIYKIFENISNHDIIKDNSFIDNLKKLRKLRKDKINLYQDKPNYSRSNSVIKISSFLTSSEDIVTKILSSQSLMK